MAATPTPCDDPNRLRALLEDRLPPCEQAELAGHLESCERCQTALEGMAAESLWWDEARRFAVDAEPRLPAHAETQAERDNSSLHFDFLDPPALPGYLGRFGPYDVIEFVGQGGSGLVFKALDPSLHRLVAVKVLAPQVAANVAARRRFLREARAAASVSHDHVVTIHAVAEANGLPYLVMQFIAGKSLQERINQSGPLELKEILRIGMQTAAGLAAAHAQGLIHRDVKPANILLENGIERVKLTDFGLARAVDDASLTSSGLIAGTPQYMSPEQAQGDAVDPRADLFGLGCVLYAMATGHSPFRAKTTMAVLRRVCDEPPRPIREANPEIPTWLTAIVDRLLAKDPAGRYQSATEVAAVLSSHLARLQQPSTPAEPEEPVAQQPTRPRWPRRLVAAAAVLVLALGTGEALGVSHVADFLATVLRIRTPNGTLVLEIEDPGVNVKIDGQDVVISGAGLQEIRLASGLHRLMATKDAQRDEALITINRGDQRLARVRLEPPDQPKIALAEPGARRPRPTIEVPVPPLSQARRPPSVTDYLQQKAKPPSSRSGVLAIEPPPPPEPTFRIELKASQGRVSDIAYSPDGRYLAATDNFERLLLYDTGTEKTGTGKPRIEAKTAQKTSDEKRSAGRGRGVPFTVTHQLDSFSPNKTDIANQLSFSPDGKLLARWGYDGKISLWEFAALVADAEQPSPKPLATLEAPGYAPRFWFLDKGWVGPPTPLAFSTDEKLLATGGVDGMVKLWDAASWKVLLGFPLRGLPAVASVRFAPDGKTIAASTLISDASERGVELWRIGAGSRPTAERLGVMDAGTMDSPARLAFSPKGGVLATFGPHIPIVFWDIGKSRGVAPFNWEATALTFSPDGTLVAAGRQSGSVTVFDAVTFQEHVSFRAGQGVIQALVFAPDGKSLATTDGSLDCLVRIWDIPSEPSRAGAAGPLRIPALLDQSTKNLGRIGLALHNYHDANGHMPAHAIKDDQGKPLLSWRVALLPFLEQVPLYNEFNLDEPWDSPHNKPLLERMPSTYAVPGAEAKPGLTSYRGFSGRGTMFDPTLKEGVTVAQVTDGMHRTIAVVEAKEAVPWTKPDSDLPFAERGKAGASGMLSALLFPGGCNALFLDGPVSFIPDTVNPVVLRALITRDGGEVISSDSF